MKKFENIVIASDIDGTILWNSSYINPKNFEKLQYFCENGGHFTLSTGRNHNDIFSIMAKLRDYVNAPCILCNGSYLYDTQTKEILNPQYLNNEKFVELAHRVREKFAAKVGIRASFTDGFLVADDDEIVLEQLKSWNLEKLAIIRPFEAFSEENLFKAVCVAESEIIPEVRALAEKEFSDFFTFTTSDSRIFEIQPLGVSKNFQFPYLKKLYNDATLWCIGDYDNDLEMLRGADVAVCPENAVDAVKVVAKHHVCHCKDGALAEMIDLIDSLAEHS